jgi:hypothetical protein
MRASGASATFGCVYAKAVCIAQTPAIVDAYVAPVGPAQLLPPHDHAAQLYRRIRQYEQAFGRSDGKEARLAKLTQAFVDFEKRWAGRDRRQRSWPSGIAD